MKKHPNPVVQTLWSLFEKWDRIKDEFVEANETVRFNKMLIEEDLKHWPYVDEEGHPE